jgi:hypothetical protein
MKMRKPERLADDVPAVLHLVVHDAAEAQRAVIITNATMLRPMASS